jgi:hypothetical protein
MAADDYSVIVSIGTARRREVSYDAVGTRETTSRHGQRSKGLSCALRGHRGHSGARHPRTACGTFVVIRMACTPWSRSRCPATARPSCGGTGQGESNPELTAISNEKSEEIRGSFVVDLHPEPKQTTHSSPCGIRIASASRTGSRDRRSTATDLALDSAEHLDRKVRTRPNASCAYTRCQGARFRRPLPRSACSRCPAHVGTDGFRRCPVRVRTSSHISQHVVLERVERRASSAAG